jgi:myo-inositol catabolism protein IolS
VETRVLGESGLRVSEIGMGCWAIGGPDWNLNMGMGWGGTDDRQSLAGLHKAFSLGVNHFDTADVYGHGHSERLLGRFLKEIQREYIVIGTKVGYFQGCAPNAYHPLHMRHQLETSLSNLGTDYVDVYYFHNSYFGESDEYLDTAIETMHRFKEEGKVRFIGQRGPHHYAPHRRAQIDKFKDKYTRFLKIAVRVKPSVIQVRYNMISPTFDKPETDVFAWAEENKVGVVMNKPLGQGLLLDKYDSHNPPKFDRGDHRRQKRWFSSDALQILQKRFVPMKERFGNAMEDLIRIALHYCLARSENACVLVGYKNALQVEMNLAVAGHYLSRNDVLFIREIMAGVNEEVGSFFTMEIEDD